jgi:hypothetical protein
VDIGFAIGSIVRLQVPGVRMANSRALGKFGGEFAQGTQTYVGQRRLVYFREPTLRTRLDVSVWPTASDIAVQANVGVQVNCGSRRRVLERSKMSHNRPQFPRLLHNFAEH